MTTYELQIDKMHCGACVRRVTQTVNSLPGTHADSVAVGSARVTTDGPLQPLLESLAQAGFPARQAGAAA